VNQISPFKSTAFRITLVYLILFGLSVGIILGFIYWSTIIYKTQQTDDEIDAEILELSLVYQQQGLPEFLTVLSERVDQLRLRPGDPSVYLLVDSRYENVISSIDRWPRVARDGGQDWLDFEVEGVSTRAKVFDIEDRYHLLVGQSMKDLTTLKALVSNAMVWGLMLTLGLGVFGGFMMRQILRSRLGAINQTSRKIMQGDLRKRIKTNSMSWRIT